MTDLLPLSILTGFLGSGKTTLLNRLLPQPALARTAVIINEFGEVALDHLLIARSEEDVLTLDSGCLCCTVRWDLVSTLDELWDKRERGEVTRFERVVIETTGLADPAPILHTLISDPKLARRFRLDGVIVTVDAVNGLSTLESHPEAVKQVAVADRLVLTKADLAPAAKGGIPADLEARLRALNPAAPILPVDEAAADGGRLFDCGLWSASTKTADVRRWLQEEAYREEDGHHHAHHDHDHHDHDHDHGEHAGHDADRHGERIRTYSIVRDQPISGAAFSLFLELLIANRGADLLRVKGILNLAERPGTPAVIHGVQHLFHPVVWLDDWPDADQRSRIVFITRDVPKSWVEHLLDVLTAPRQEAAAADAPAEASR